MRIFCFVLLLLSIHATGFSQEDGYLSETGTNGRLLVKKNKITKEIVCNYSYCTNLKGIPIFADVNKIILTDSVTIFFDEYGCMQKRIREMKKSPGSTLVDTFYYDLSNRLVQIGSTTNMNGQEADIGYAIYTYNNFGKVARHSSSYTLQNGIIKNSEDEYVYNDNGQLIEVWKKSNISSLVLSEKYFYTRRGRIKRIENYDGDYNLVFRYWWRSIRIFSNNENEFYHKTRLFFNRHNQCVKKVHGDCVEEFVYNPDGTLAESSKHYDGNMVSITTHKYVVE
ncbi:hypothetical protein [Parasediminibacterium sp. JCM 36343]|uniref:hypothetical protein n=1 Tax=Parasediminibacterium sp. JCM 36343 TaxID=3374279 RepID=UPI003979DEBA